MSEKYIIFGATGSIGSSLAEKLTGDKAEIHLVARNQDEVKPLAERLGCTYTVADVLQDGFIDKVKTDVMNSVKSVLRAEFINRLDDILFYTKLGKSEISKIVEIELNFLRTKLNNMSISLIWSEEVIKTIALEGFNPEFGARPIKRTIRELIENYISDKIVKNEIIEGSSIKLSVVDQEISFHIH